jgi:nucleotide-binding universal stress UspA family protein
MFHHILVAIDSSNASKTALEMTVELAKAVGATVRVLHIDTSEVVYDTVVELEDAPVARQILEGAVATVRQAGVTADGELVDTMVSDIADAVRDAADRFGAGLIVISPHHRSRLSAWFSPRVSDAIAHKTNTAVLLAPWAG